jgi:hypothetical protein
MGDKTETARQYWFADNEINPKNEFKERQKDSNIFIHTVFPVGHFYNKKYGDVWMSRDSIEKMVENFGKYPDYEVPVKFGHGDGVPSPGTVIGLSSTERGLEATFRVNADASEGIRRKLYRYTSGEMDSEYLDPKTGDNVGPVFLGLALVNQPGLPYMEPLQFVDAGVGDPDPAQEENHKEDTDMSEENKSAPEVKTEPAGGVNAEFAAEKARLEAELKASQMERDKLAADKAEHEKKIAELTAAQEAAKLETAKTKVSNFSEAALKKITPNALKVLEPLLKPEHVMTFADTAENSPLKVLTEFIEALPENGMMQQKGFSDVTGAHVVAGAAAADVERGKRMAEHVNKSVATK